MVTINHGQKIPDQYLAIKNLPEVIESLERDLSGAANGDSDYTEDEIVWLHQFHSSCGDRHNINTVDIESAVIHGPAAFRRLTTIQQKDLAAYFNRSFAKYTPVETSPAQRLESLEVIVWPLPATPEDFVAWREDTIERFFTVNPTHGRKFFEQDVFPHIQNLSQKDQQVILSDLQEMPPALEKLEAWEWMENLFRQHDLPFTLSYGAGLFFQGCWSDLCRARD